MRDELTSGSQSMCLDFARVNFICSAASPDSLPNFSLYSLQMTLHMPFPLASRSLNWASVSHRSSSGQPSLIRLRIRSRSTFGCSASLQARLSRPSGRTAALTRESGRALDLAGRLDTFLTLLSFRLGLPLGSWAGA